MHSGGNLRKARIETRRLVPDEPTQSKRHLEAEYDFTDESGKVIFQTIRLFAKDFRQRQRDEKEVGAGTSTT
jgi:hypothetical protein